MDSEAPGAAAHVAAALRSPVQQIRHGDQAYGSRIARFLEKRTRQRSTDAHGPMAKDLFLFSPPGFCHVVRIFVLFFPRGFEPMYVCVCGCFFFFLIFYLWFKGTRFTGSSQALFEATRKRMGKVQQRI